MKKFRLVAVVIVAGLAQSAHAGLFHKKKPWPGPAPEPMKQTIVFQGNGQGSSVLEWHGTKTGYGSASDAVKTATIEMSIIHLQGYPMSSNQYSPNLQLENLPCAENESLSKIHIKSSSCTFDGQPPSTGLSDKEGQWRCEATFVYGACVQYGSEAQRWNGDMSNPEHGQLLPRGDLICEDEPDLASACQ